MKTGICTLLLASEKDPLAAAKISALGGAGYDYAELPLARLYSLDHDALCAHRGAFADAGLPVEAFNNGVPAGMSIVGDEVTDAALDAYIDRAVELADFFGVKMITTSGPNARRVPEGFDWQGKGRARYVRFLQKYASTCAKSDIAIALEPICRAEHGFVNTTAQALSLIRDAGCSNVALLVDFFHFNEEGEDPALLPAYVKRGLIAHLHIARHEGRSIPTSDDVPKFTEMLLPLREAGFEGRISVEAYPVSGRDVREGALAIRLALQ